MPNDEIPADIQTAAPADLLSALTIEAISDGLITPLDVLQFRRQPAEKVGVAEAWIEHLKTVIHYDPNQRNRQDDDD